jgi:hypothetical protein
MGWLLKVLALPVWAPVRGTMWLAEKIAGQAEREYYDEDAVRAQLMELELRLDLGEIDDEAYEQAEASLLERLAEIRKHWEEGA